MDNTDSQYDNLSTQDRALVDAAVELAQRTPATPFPELGSTVRDLQLYFSNPENLPRLRDAAIEGATTVASLLLNERSQQKTQERLARSPKSHTERLLDERVDSAGRRLGDL